MQDHDMLEWHQARVLLRALRGHSSIASEIYVGWCSSWLKTSPGPHAGERLPQVAPVTALRRLSARGKPWAMGKPHGAVKAGSLPAKACPTNPKQGAEWVGGCPGPPPTQGFKQICGDRLGSQDRMPGPRSVGYVLRHSCHRVGTEHRPSATVSA